MGSESFSKRTRLAASADEVFAWHARPGALERLTPPWQSIEVEERTGGLKEGARVVLRVGPLGRRWVAVHRRLVPGREFVDEQVSGPFARWIHTHRFQPEGPDASVLEDHVEYALPCGLLGRIAGGWLVRSEIARLFRYRHAVTGDDLEVHRRHQGRGPMHVAITGASGLVGSHLVPFLTGGGHQVSLLTRPGAAARSGDTFRRLRWDPQTGIEDLDGLRGVDAVVHLAGQNISASRWTPAFKAAIRQSRGEATRRLAESLARLDPPPRVLVSASAVGFFGDRGGEELDEESEPGRGFLADVCQEWEAATEAAEDAGIRVAHLRFGLVLTPAGGTLERMLLPFKLGMAGKIGDGRQFMSWIGIDDALGSILHALSNDAVVGPVNAVSPVAVTNGEFTRILARVLGRPAFFSMPAFAARMIFGEMAEDTLLASTRAVPTKLLSTGYRFRHPDLEGVLRHLLGR